MTMKHLLAVTLSLVGLATSPAFAQFPARGDDSVQSYGLFQIQVDKKFASLFAGCPAYNSTTDIFQSPTLYDSQTKIGRSDVIREDSPGDATGAGFPVGTAGTIIGDNRLSPPPGFPKAKDTREIHTEIRSLKMVTYPSGPPAAVRAGVWYNSASSQSPPPPAFVSGGEVKSKSGNSNDPKKDFPAISFFDVYAQVDLPPCGGFPGGTVFNRKPLLVSADDLHALPPDVVYIHDQSITTVPILFAADSPGGGKLWKKDQALGCFVLAGHGVNVTAAELSRVLERHRGGRCASEIIKPEIIKPGVIKPEVVKPK